jgi:hypothetical protein
MTALFSCLCVSSTVTNIKNLVAEIVAVLVPTSKDNGVSPFSSTTGDTGYAWAMNAGPREFDTGGEAAPFRVGWHVTKDALDH